MIAIEKLATTGSEAPVDVVGVAADVLPEQDAPRKLPMKMWRRQNWIWTTQIPMQMAKAMYGTALNTAIFQLGPTRSSRWWKPILTIGGEMIIAAHRAAVPVGDASRPRAAS